VKNQYFGDTRDLFKFDIIEKFLFFHQYKTFMFIPMLTEDDFSNDGQIRNYSKSKAGNKNIELINFFYKYCSKKSKNIYSINKYFKAKGIISHIYSPEKIRYLTQKNRDQYFSELKKQIRSTPFIFIDPDIGLEVKNSTEKHLKIKELNSILEKAEKKACICIFQFKPRMKNDMLFNQCKKKLTKLPLKTIGGISDNKVLFLFISKTKSPGIISFINSYQISYRELSIYC
jgi:hypothetical protein